MVMNDNELILCFSNQCNTNKDKLLEKKKSAMVKEGRKIPSSIHLTWRSETNIGILRALISPVIYKPIYLCLANIKPS